MASKKSLTSPSVSGPDSLRDIDLQVTDITTNPEWERAYQYEIPVLVRVPSDGTEMKFEISKPVE